MTDRPRVAIHDGLEGVESLTGTVVVIDVFRASNTIAALLAAGAQEVALFADIEQARRYNRRHPERPLLGERGGITPDDFDGGNSPANAHRLVETGNAPILTTSAGTQAVGRLGAADAVYIAGFCNAEVVVRLLRRNDSSQVNLLPMGLEARESAVEDDEAARWIAARLDGRTPEFEQVRDRLLACSGARRLRRLGQEDDLEFCTTLDSLSIVPKVVPGDPPRAVRAEDSRS